MSFPAGTYLRSTIADQGCDIPEDYLKRIFDPCFTSKIDGEQFGICLVREIADSILTHHRYSVTTCSNGEEATELYRKSLETGEPFHAVAMDLTIPGGIE